MHACTKTKQTPCFERTSPTACLLVVSFFRFLNFFDFAKSFFPAARGELSEAGDSS